MRFFALSILARTDLLPRRWEHSAGAILRKYWLLTPVVLPSPVGHEQLRVLGNGAVGIEQRQRVGLTSSDWCAPITPSELRFLT